MPKRPNTQEIFITIGYLQIEHTQPIFTETLIVFGTKNTFEMNFHKLIIQVTAATVQPTS